MDRQPDGGPQRARVADARVLPCAHRRPRADEGREGGPAPGPDGLPELARRAGAGLTARGLEGLPEGVGVAVYRIVQEALTNVVRHAVPGSPR